MYTFTARTIGSGVAVALCLLAFEAYPQIAVSSNDHKMVQENGVTRNLTYPPPDTITILDLGASPVRVVGTVSDVPGSVVGPPLSVVITPDESLAVVASSTQINPGDRSKTIPDDRLTVVDLKDRKVLGRVKTGPGAAGMSISADGKRLYVANRSAGSISILKVDNRQLSMVRTETLGTPESLASHIAVSPDGLTGLVTMNGAAKVEIVKFSGDQVWRTNSLATAPRPYPAVFHPSGKFAVVGCGGDPKGNGVLTVIDFSDPAGKVVATVDIGYESLEGMMMSPDGKWVAAVAHAGSTRPKDAPQYQASGRVLMYRVDGAKLTKTGEAPIGAWSQGAAFSKDGGTVVVQNMIQQNIQVFRNDNGKLVDTGQTIATGGGPAAIRSSSSN